jgi:hypothetical protein
MSYIGKTPTSVPLTSSDITDGIISLPKLTDGTDGNLISYDASGNPVAVATGTDGQVLTSTGAGSPPAFETLPGGGKVLQVVSTSKTNTFSVSSSTYTDVTDLSVSITPSSASNKILVLCYLNGSSNQAVGSIVTRLVRGSTAISVGDASGSRIQGSSDQTVADSNHQSNMNIKFLDSPATTSATTYKIQIRGDSTGNHQVSINRSQADSDNDYNTRTASSITVMEIAG